MTTPYGAQQQLYPAAQGYPIPNVTVIEYEHNQARPYYPYPPRRSWR